MRFMALQTDIEKLKKQFVVEGEEEIVTTAHHPFIMIATSIIVSLILLVVAGIVAMLFFLEIDGPVVIGIVVVAGLLYSGHLLLKSYIDWRFDSLIVTTEKVVVVDHYSFLYQNVNPIHLDNIASTKFESQFFGLWRCGIVHICLKERESGSTKEVTLRYIPQPDVVASAVENAIAIAKQRAQGETPKEQEPKVEETQEKVIESVQEEPSAPTVQPPT